MQACDLGLATAVAGLAAAHALSFLDGELPASTGTRWEAALPLLDWRSERIGAHLGCSCGATGHTEGSASPGAKQHTTQWLGNRLTRYGSLGFGGAHV